MPPKSPVRIVGSSAAMALYAFVASVKAVPPEREIDSLPVKTPGGKPVIDVAPTPTSPVSIESPAFVTVV